MNRIIMQSSFTNYQKSFWIVNYTLVIFVIIYIYIYLKKLYLITHSISKY